MWVTASQKYLRPWLKGLSREVNTTIHGSYYRKLTWLPKRHMPQSAFNSCTPLILPLYASKSCLWESWRDQKSKRSQAMAKLWAWFFAVFAAFRHDRVKTRSLQRCASVKVITDGLTGRTSAPVALKQMINRTCGLAQARIQWASTANSSCAFGPS